MWRNFWVVLDLGFFAGGGVEHFEDWSRFAEDDSKAESRSDKEEACAVEVSFRYKSCKDWKAVGFSS